MRRKPVFAFFSAVLIIALSGNMGAQSVYPLVEPNFKTSAKSAMLLEIESGTVLYAYNEQERLPPASVTKIMTMLLIMEAIDSGRATLDDPITTSRYAAGIGGSQVYLKEGETFTLREMLISIAVVSANDASTAVSEYLYSTEDDFVRIMNARAKELGMKNTHFANAHGLPDPEHYMSAADIALVSRELINKHPGILEFTSIWTHTLRPGVTVLRNTNELINTYRGADGLKTGHTQSAGWCLVGTAERADMRLISVVLGTDSNEARLRETKRLLDYGFRNFERRVVAEKGTKLGSVAVADAWPVKIKVEAPTRIVAIVPRAQERKITTRLKPRSDVRAPLPKGAVIADLEILHSGKVIGNQPITAAGKVGRANFIVRGWRALIRWISNLFGGR